MKIDKNLNSFSPDRRGFLKKSVAAAGVLLATPMLNHASTLWMKDTYTVKEIMDLFISQLPGGALTETVDTLKSGKPDTVVTGIVVTSFATIEVIRKTIDLGANFIICHEPTFYNHQDDTKWLANDEVYNYKAELLKKHNIAVWRNHDYIHRLVPDGVRIGVLDKLGWKNYEAGNNVLNVPKITLSNLIAELKSKLNIQMVRYIGKPDQLCSKLLLLPGAVGVRDHLSGIAKYKPDVLICGELSEWETAEYVRDAEASGQNISLIVLGHIASEEPGSDFVLNWLAKNVPSIKATHIPSGNSLSFM
jgi:putative NIF3 family GTP cyclohydrolase 1 type 2